MPERHLPVRPDLEQLRHQAKDLLRAMHHGDASALSDLAHYHPERIDAAATRLSDAQLVLARSYGAPSWMRLVQSCELIDAIWRDDRAAVRELVTKNPDLLTENAGIGNKNWGPPMTYAANLGRDAIIAVLYMLGARDVASALDRATLQGQVETARKLHGLLETPIVADELLGGPAYTLSTSGTAFALELGARVVDERGRPIAPVDVVLETDSRKPADKHAILEMYVKHGLVLPDTPTMALHRGRIDLLERHLSADRGLLSRRFS